jgi:hypothetical protein
MKPYLLFFSIVLFFSCNPENPVTLTDFELNKNKWETLGIDSYTFTFQISCYCLREDTLPKTVQVVNGKIVKVDGATYDEDEHWGVQTISQLFNLIEQSEKEKVHTLEVDYHPDKGFPTMVYIDRDEMIADEEMGYHVRDLEN